MSKADQANMSMIDVDGGKANIIHFSGDVDMDHEAKFAGNMAEVATILFPSLGASR